MTAFGGTAGKVLEALRPHGLKANGTGSTFHANAVWRNGDSMGLSIAIHDDEHGTWHDHARDESGSLYELAGRLGIETPQGTGSAIATTKRSYTGLADYAEAHGLTPEALAAAGWEATTHGKRPCLSFPTASGMRYRYLDGNKPHYISEQGYKPCWYGLKKAATLATKLNAALVICNGEISTVAAQHHGIPACCVTSGEKAIPPHLMAELKQAWTGPIWLTFDNDSTGRATAASIAQQLPGAQVLNLWGQGDDGADLADFVMLYRGAALDELRKKASVVSTAPSSPVPASTAPATASVNSAQLFSMADLLAKAARAKAEPELIMSAATRLQAEVSAILRRTQSVQSHEVGDVAVTAFSELKARIAHPAEVTGLRTNFPDLDRRLLGLQKGAVYAVLAETSMGKSWFAASLVGAFVRQNTRGYIVTTEMGRAFWLRRVAAYMACVDDTDMQRGRVTPEQLKAIDRAYCEIASTASLMNDTPSPTIEALEIALSMATEMENLDWIVFDSASRLTVSGVTDMLQRHNMVAEWLLTIAKAMNVPVVFTAQSGRNGKDRQDKRPQLWDFQHSSAYEQNADAVLGLYRAGKYDDALSMSPEAEIIVLKDRRGGASGYVARARSILNQGWYSEPEALR